jgi:hypothetical protein
VTKDNAPKVEAATALEAFQIITAMRPDRHSETDGRMMDRDELLGTMAKQQRKPWNKAS